MTDPGIHSDTAAKPLGNYPHAKRVGECLFLSGIGPRSRDTGAIPGVTLNPDGSLKDYDIEAQVRAVFDNIRHVLHDAGSRWEDIIDVLVFLTDMQRDFKRYNELWAEFFPKGGNQPCRTTIEVSKLPQGGDAPIAVEMKVVARY